jgi:Cdc6-like AAA superfamily ATPase
MKNTFYITGKQGTGKTNLTNALKDSVEISLSERQEGESLLSVCLRFFHKQNIVFTSQEHSNAAASIIKNFALEEGRYFYEINLNKIS